VAVDLPPTPGTGSLAETGGSPGSRAFAWVVVRTSSPRSLPVGARSSGRGDGLGRCGNAARPGGERTDRPRDHREPGCAPVRSGDKHRHERKPCNRPEDERGAEREPGTTTLADKHRESEERAEEEGDREAGHEHSQATPAEEHAE
jgi:hypothetical protein